jgi:hypothetical protein
LVDGTYWLYVRADAPDSVYELDETNNLADRRITVTRNTADLQVTRIGHDATGTAGQGLAVDWRVDNEGSSQTNIGYWYDAAYLSLDQTLDGNDALATFADTLEKVCVDTVEAGFMSKDLALLVGDKQSWLTTEGFLDKVDENLKAAMAKA